MQGIINMSKSELLVLRMSLTQSLDLVNKKLQEEERADVSTSARPKGKKPVADGGVEKIKNNRLKTIYRVK